MCLSFLGSSLFRNFPQHQLVVCYSTFRDNLSVPSARAKASVFDVLLLEDGTDTLPRNGGSKKNVPVERRPQLRYDETPKISHILVKVETLCPRVLY
jgi:hypothetical protein